MSAHDNATPEQVVGFLEDAMTELAILIRTHELCPSCATQAFIRVLVTALDVGLIKELDKYTDEEKERLPYFNEAADGFFYTEGDTIGDCVGTA